MAEWRVEDSKRNNTYSVYDLQVSSHALAQESLPWGSWNFYNFGRPFVGHHIYILSLSVLCLGVEKKKFKIYKKMHFIIRLRWPHPCTRIPAPGVMKYTLMVDPTLVIITIHLGCMDHAPGKRRCFYSIQQFYTFYLPSYFPLVRGTYNVFSQYPIDAKYQIWLRLAQ